MGRRECGFVGAHLFVCLCVFLFLLAPCKPWPSSWALRLRLYAFIDSLIVHISCVTLLILMIILHVLCKAKLVKHAELCFVFPVEKVAVSLAKTAGEGASSAERKRVRQWSLFSKNKNQRCIPQPVSNTMFFSFGPFSLLVTFLSYEVSWHSQSECSTPTLDTYILYGWQIALFENVNDCYNLYRSWGERAVFWWR